MTDPNIAAAIKRQQDSKDMTNIALDIITSAAEREGRPFERADFGQSVGLLLGAAWKLAKIVHEDDAMARALYVRHLRAHADAVDWLPRSD